MRKIITMTDNPFQNGKIENVKRMETAGKIRLCFVKVIFDNGGEEYLVTNLSEEEVDIQEMAELYQKDYSY